MVLPHGTGKTVRVLVFAKGDKAHEAEEAGADYIGDEATVQKIQKENWFEFDVCVATPDMMGVVGRIGRILGPKGLMPNPKSGTVTMDVAKAIKDIKAGKVEYRVDKTNICHCPIGKVPLPHRQGFLRPREAEREFDHPHGGDHQGQARRRQGYLHQEPGGFHHHGPRRQGQRPEVLKKQPKSARGSSRAFCLFRKMSLFTRCILYIDAVYYK